MTTLRMTGLRLFGFLARILLAGLPIAAAAVFVSFFARDISETASAVLAVAALLSAASLAQVAILIRDTKRIGQMQDETRAQALALARCMKALNHRMADLEEGRGEGAAGEAAPPPAAALIALAPATAPEFTLKFPPSALTEPALALPGTTDRDGPDPILTLPQRKLWGYEIEKADSPGFSRLRPTASEDARLSARIRAASAMLDGPAQPGGAPRLLVVSNLALSAAPGAMDMIVALSASDARFRERFLLGVPQRVIRSGGAAEALILARLARAGIRFALTDVVDFRIDPEALAACSITHVRIEARRLIAAAQDGMTAAATSVADLGARLAAGGITLMCNSVDDEKLTPDLNELQVALAQGPALATGLPALGNVTPMPWRAAPAAVGVAAMPEPREEWRAMRLTATR